MLASAASGSDLVLAPLLEADASAVALADLAEVQPLLVPLSAAATRLCHRLLVSMAEPAGPRKRTFAKVAAKNHEDLTKKSLLGNHDSWDPEYLNHPRS